MQLHQLLEATTPSLTSIWTSPIVDGLARMLAASDSSTEQLLASLMQKAIAKHASNDPSKLFSLVKPLLNTHRDTTTRAIRDQIDAVLTDVADTSIKIGGSTFEALAAAATPAQLKGKINQKVGVRYALAYNKLNRTPDEEDFDDTNDQFVFIARPSFKEVPKGSGNFRKTLEIENMVKVDRFDVDAHQMVGMMKLRANVQGEGSEVYIVDLPKGTMKGGRPDAQLIDLINQHKRPVTH